MDEQFNQDRAIIRELIENWALCRDTAQWEEFRKVWHPDGRMRASWKQDTVEGFIAASQQGMELGVSILHMLGGSWVKVNGNRAISQTRFEILQRADVDGVLCDVVSVARHYDFWEKRSERWGLLLRETVFDKARIDPVKAGETLAIDWALYNEFPEEYAALAYLQEKSGHTVQRNMPHGWREETVGSLYRRGDAWLSGELAVPWES